MDSNILPVCAKLGRGGRGWGGNVELHMLTGFTSTCHAGSYMGEIAGSWRHWMCFLMASHKHGPWVQNDSYEHRRPDPELRATTNET